MRWDRMPQYNCSVTVNRLYWITSLEANQLGTTRRVTEDLGPFFDKLKLDYRFFHPQTAKELHLGLAEIATDARTGVKPIIHFDMHGDENRGLFIADSDEFIRWQELYEMLRLINEHSGNNLCVISTACYSSCIVNEIKFHQTCPFYIMISPEKDVLSGDLESNTFDFYAEIFRSGSITQAFDNNLSGFMTLYHCERLALIVFSRYFRNHCMGRGGKRRKEGLLTEALRKAIPTNDRQSRRAARQTIKEAVRPTPETLSEFAGRFLIGREPSFNFNDVMNLIR